MKQNTQNAADLLRAYFRETPSSNILQDWQSVQDFEMDCISIDEFLSQEIPTQPLYFDETLFDWKKMLCVDSPDGFVEGEGLSSFNKNAGEYQYAMAA